MPIMSLNCRRNVAAYVLLTVVTLGIYPLCFWYDYVKDVNILCGKDGGHTRSILLAQLFQAVCIGLWFVGFYGGTIHGALMNRDAEDILEWIAALSGVVAIVFIAINIYLLVWAHGVQERLRATAVRNGMGLMPGGGSVVCWKLFGWILGGWYVSHYILFDSLNRIAYFELECNLKPTNE